MTVVFILGLFLVGMLLIAVEVILIPGITFAGLLGAATLFYGGYVAWEMSPALAIALGVGSMVLTFALIFYGPRSRLGQKMTLKSKIDGISQYDRAAREAGVGVGQVAHTATELRPSGYALFGEDRIEVRTEGEFVEREIKVEVVAMRNGQVIVEPVVEND